MTKYEPDKFIVINRKHLDELKGFMPYGDANVNQLMESINMLYLSYHYHTDKELGQKYYVCNQDEPYAQKVIDIILEGEREKENE